MTNNGNGNGNGPARPIGLLERLLNDWLVQQRQKDQMARDHSKFWASDAGRCRLMRFWRRQGREETDPSDERSLRIFAVGKAFHLLIQQMLRDAGKLFAAEMTVETTHIIGHVDGLIRENGHLALYDFKTVHSRKFWHTDGDRHYRLQTATYRLLLPKGIQELVKVARVAYISRDDLLIKEVEITEEDVQEACADWDALITAWKAQEEPAPNPSSWECARYCPYRSACPFARQFAAQERKQTREPFAD